MSSPKHANPRPKLYVLALKPTIPSRASETSEWILDLCVPSVAGSAIPSERTSRSQSFTNLAQAADSTTEPAKPKDATPPTESHYYFSRLLPSTYAEERPQGVVLQIFLTSFPSQDNAQPRDTDIVTHFNTILDTIHLTPDATLWLRQALLALQVAEVLPPISHGLEVTKFISFATSYLSEYMQTSGGGSAEPKQVNYSHILVENDHPSRKFSTAAPRGSVVGSSDEKSHDMEHDEDVWNLPVRGKPSRAEKNWGGFWVTRGSGANTPRSGSRERGESGKTKA